MPNLLTIKQARNQVSCGLASYAHWEDSNIYYEFNPDGTINRYEDGIESLDSVNGLSGDRNAVLVDNIPWLEEL